MVIIHTHAKIKVKGQMQ